MYSAVIRFGIGPGLFVYLPIVAVEWVVSLSILVPLHDVFSSLDRSLECVEQISLRACSLMI